MFVRWPTDYVDISQKFDNPNSWETQKHSGVDLRPKRPGVPGDPIYAPADGFAVWARPAGQAFAAGNPWDQLPNNGSGGGTVILQHVAPNQATCTQYNHLSRIVVEEGQWCPAGTLLGYMGWTGFVLPANPFGTHLHWEMFIDYGNGDYPAGTFYGRVNPLDYMNVVSIVPVTPGPSGDSVTGTPRLLLPGVSGITIKRES